MLIESREQKTGHQAGVSQNQHPRFPKILEAASHRPADFLRRP